MMSQEQINRLTQEIDKMNAKTATMIDRKVKSAINEASNLIETMQRLIADLQENGEGATFNPLGEANYEATRVDRLLAEIAVLRDLQSKLD